MVILYTSASVFNKKWTYMEIKRERNSRLEIVRIVAMLGIVLSHWGGAQ